MNDRRMILAALLVTGVSAAAASLGHAQSYPNRPIKMILPYTAGSPNDVIARLIAPPLSSRLGQAVVVDNRPGGGTTIGAEGRHDARSPTATRCCSPTRPRT